MQLSNELYTRFKEALLNTGKFGSLEDLKVVFQVEELAPYLPGLPDTARNEGDRIDKTIQYLTSQTTREGHPVFILFVQSLLTFTVKESGLYLQLEQLLEEVQHQSNGHAVSQDEQDIPSPYKGLLRFEKEDADYFFGRADKINELVNVVRDNQLVNVIGASGSGKSSLVRAGLVPCLGREKEWLIASCHPGDYPLWFLAQGLVPLLEPRLSGTDQLAKTDQLSELLKKDHVLYSLGEQLVQQYAARHLLLIIDQFEELYTLCKTPADQQYFLDLILKTKEMASARHTFNFHIVITLRADFFKQTLDHEALSGAKDMKLGPMSSAQLREVIEGPANKCRVNIQEDLTDSILDTISQKPGNLPLLEFALDQLWKKQKELNGGKLTRNATLTRTAYDEIGGVEKALADFADDAYNKLKPEEQKTAQKVFVQLVHPASVNPDVSTGDTRRISTREQLKNDGWALARRLSESDTRLVIIDAVPNGPQTAEIVHEALIQHWDKLQGWVNADREFRSWQDRVQAALEQWQNNKEEDVPPLSGALLSGARHWLVDEKRGQDLSFDQRDFLFRGILNRALDEENRGVDAKNRAIALEQWIPQYGTIGETLDFLRQYIVSNDEKKRYLSIEALQALPQGDEEDAIYTHLQNFILYDTSSRVRDRAAQAVYEQGHISRLLDLLAQLPAKEKKQRKERRQIIRALASVRNIPTTGKEVKPALHRYRWQISREASWQVISSSKKYRNEFALVIALSYGFLQIGYLILSIPLNILDKIFHLTVTYYTNFDFLDVLIAVTLGTFFIIRTKVIDKENISLKKCITIGTISVLIANIVVILSVVTTSSNLVYQIYHIRAGQNVQFSDYASSLLYEVYYPLYSVLSGLIGIAIFATSFRVNISHRQSVWKLLYISLLSSIFAVLVPFLVGLLLQFSLFPRLFLSFPRLILLFTSLTQANFSLLNQSGQALITNVHALFFDILITFLALLGFRFGLRFTHLDEAMLEQTGATVPVIASSTQSASPSSPQPGGFNRQRGLSGKSQAVLVTLLLLALVGSIGFFYSPTGYKLAVDLTGSALWTAPTGSFIRSSPVVVNGVVYVGSDDQNLYAFDATTGAKKWAAPTRGRILSSPVVVNGVVYVGSDPSPGLPDLYAFDAATGANLWTATTNIASNFSPEVANGIVYLDSSSYNTNSIGEVLQGLDARTGKVLWRAPIGSFILAAPVVSNDIIYVSSDDNKLHAFNARTGVEMWKQVFTGESINLLPTISNNLVYILQQNLGDSKLYAFNARTGGSKWITPLRNIFSSYPPVIANGIIYINSGNHDLDTLDAITGKPMWKISVAGYLASSSTVVGNGMLYLAPSGTLNTNGTLNAYDAKTGKSLWSNTLVGYFDSRSLLISGNVLVETVYGQPDLYAFNAKTGDILWAGSAKSSTDPPFLTVANGVLYAGSDDKNLYAFHLPNV